MRFRIVPRVAVIGGLAVGISVGGPTVAFADDLPVSQPEIVSGADSVTGASSEGASPVTESPDEEPLPFEEDGSSDGRIADDSGLAQDGEPVVVASLDSGADTEDPSVVPQDMSPFATGELIATTGSVSARIHGCVETRYAGQSADSFTGSCGFYLTWPEGTSFGASAEIALPDVFASSTFQGAFGALGLPWVDSMYQVCAEGVPDGTVVGISSAGMDPTREHGTLREYTFVYSEEVYLLPDGLSLTASYGENFVSVGCTTPEPGPGPGPNPAPEPGVGPEIETPAPTGNEEPRSNPAPTAVTERLADTGASSWSGDCAIIAALAALVGVGLVVRTRRFKDASRSA